MLEEKELEIDPLKQYHFPSEIREIHHDGKWIVVAATTANWIVLDNEEQLRFFHLLKKYPLGEALSLFDGEEEDAQWVVVQLEARAFERTDVMLKQEDASAHIYLTNGCNMRCPHCYMFAGEEFANELSYEEHIAVIDGLIEGGVKSVVFSGGEPLLNPKFRDLVKHAKKGGLHVEVLSNGTLWTESIIDELSGYVDKVQISVDGFDEESNSQIRGKGNFKKALHTIDYLLSKNITTSLAMVPKYSDTLEDNIDRYVEFAKGLLSKYDTSIFSFNIVGDVWEGRDFNLSKKEKSELSRIVSEIFKRIYGEGSEDGPFIEFHKRFGIEENCAYGNLSFAANGDVYLCAQIQPLHPIGNVRTDSIKDLLKLSEQAKQKSEISNLKPCGKCAIRYICGGDCRIKHFSLFDTGIIPTDCEHPERSCTEEYRNSMYDLMIRTNEFIFQ